MGASAATASTHSQAARQRARRSTSSASNPPVQGPNRLPQAMRVDGMPLALLVNPSSAHGRTLKLLPQLEQELDARRISFRVERTRGREDGVVRALRAAEANEVPVVVSGDGLIGAVGGALAGSETPLGIVPGGRGNDLARTLGIPNEPDRAVEAILAGNTRRIDV